eukprot:gb/GEZN01015203.1/.p1 GENE.gb/GEZN01015203.1/~~gb/GEZN01015203.1/.p1  ORF type:complete len:136 (+),score=0.15 gb/GEZN01015203.1/:275-682(+)
MAWKAFKRPNGTGPIQNQTEHISLYCGVLPCQLSWSELVVYAVSQSNENEQVKVKPSFLQLVCRDTCSVTVCDETLVMDRALIRKKGPGVGDTSNITQRIRRTIKNTNTTTNGRRAEIRWAFCSQSFNGRTDFAR